jgi:hypothetical protein
MDDDQRDAFAGHLDGVGVTELVWREAAPHALLPRRRCTARAAAGDQRRPRVAPSITQSNAPTGSARRGSIQG